MYDNIVNDYIFLKDVIKILNLKTSISTLKNKCEDFNIKIEKIYHIKARKPINAIHKNCLRLIEYIYNNKTLNDILKENHISQDVFYNAEERLGLKKKFNDLTKDELNLILEYCKLSRKDKIKKGICDSFGSIANFQKYTLEKRIKTNLKKYGVENVFQSEEIKEKSKQTFLKKYGVEHALQNKEILNNQKQTIKNKYGVENASQSEEIKLKKKETLNSHIEDFKNNKGFIALSETGINRSHSVKTIFHIINKFNIKIVYYMDIPFIKKEDFRLIMNELKNVDYSKTSVGEKEIYDFVKSIYKDKIVENDRNIIFPKELDIYIPSKNVAVEFDGVYFHSELFKKDKYNLYNKTNLCNEKGIRLIHIFEDDWYEKREICKSIIASSLGIYEKRIFARKCEIREVENKECKEFLIQNHLNGFAQSKYKYGLYYNNELVMITCFGKSRRCDDVELIRVCSKLNTQVIGGFSKLIKYFKSKNPQFKKLTSFINRNVFDGKGYLNSGFKIENYSKPSYWWVKQSKRYNRENFQKKKLAKILKNYNENLTEVENMHNNKYYRLFNCGTIKVIYDLQN